MCISLINITYLTKNGVNYAEKFRLRIRSQSFELKYFSKKS
jgi:hypothetical protein